jgi:hypothetical protein
MVRAMRAFVAAILLASSFSPAISLPAYAAKAAAKNGPAKGAAGVSDASVAACAAEFVDALNSLDDERVLSALSPSDRIALRGRPSLIGLVFGKKILDPQVKSFEKVEKDGKLLGAKVVVSVNEVDPLEQTKSAKDHTWFLALDEKNFLKVSLSSVWLDTGKIGSPE